MRKTLLDRIKDKYDNAEALIRTGKVFVNNKEVFIPSTFVKEKDKILVKESKKYVSRGAYKLLKAISYFDLNLKDQVILDIGSSTGGFTQVALEFQAQHVFALDVGTNQLDYLLRTHQQVTVLEKTNLKTINPKMFHLPIDIVVCDVSFISLKEVFNVIKTLNIKFALMLIKPQYEANSNQILDGGIAPLKIHEEVISKVKNYAKENNFVFKGLVESPIKGAKSKNIEYLALFTFNN